MRNITEIGNLTKKVYKERVGGNPAELVRVYDKAGVSVHRAPHLFCCRTLEVQKYFCAHDALHLRYPVNAYN